MLTSLLITIKTLLRPFIKIIPYFQENPILTQRLNLKKLLNTPYQTIAKIVIHPILLTSRKNPLPKIESSLD